MSRFVFLCSPLRGDYEGNLRKAKEYCRWATLEKDKIPLAPHVYFTHFLDESVEVERLKGINLGIELLEKCDEVWVILQDDDRENISEGMRMEINHAKRLRKPIQYINESEIVVDGYVNSTR